MHMVGECRRAIDKRKEGTRQRARHLCRGWLFRMSFCENVKCAANEMTALLQVGGSSWSYTCGCGAFSPPLLPRFSLLQLRLWQMELKKPVTGIMYCLHVIFDIMSKLHGYKTAAFVGSLNG